MLAQLIALKANVRYVEIDGMPMAGPTYTKRGFKGRERTMQCPRIAWTTHDGRRFFAFVEPRHFSIERKPLTLLGLPLGATWIEDVQDSVATLESAVKLIRSTLGEGESQS